MKTTPLPPQPLSYGVVFLEPDIRDFLAQPAVRRRTINYFRALAPCTFYLQCGHRGSGLSIPAGTVRAIKADLALHGITAAGSIIPAMPARASIRNGVTRPLCYNNPADMQSLEQQVRFHARHFDTLILDDWLFTICTCPACVAARGRQSWASYRRTLLVRQARRHVIAPAREVNPRVQLVIKYPNWLEGFHHNGYDIGRHLRQFDAFCTGIETRSHVHEVQHFPLYHSYFLQRLLCGVSPAKGGRCWLDNLQMDDDRRIYAAQAYQGVLGGGRELILWCAGSHLRTDWAAAYYPLFTRAMPQLAALAARLTGRPLGVETYLPEGADGEYNIFGYLGMIGIPLQPVMSFPRAPGTCVLTRHAAHDPRLADKILARLRAGHNVMLTWELFKQLQDTEIGRVVPLLAREGSVAPATFRVQRRRGAPLQNPHGIAFPKLLAPTWPYGRVVAGVRADGDFIVLYRANYLNGIVYLLVMPENAHDVLRLPPEVLDKIRAAAMPAMPLWLSGPGHVSLYLYDDATAVIFNAAPARAQCELVVPDGPHAERWRARLRAAGLALRAGDGETRAALSLGTRPGIGTPRARSAWAVVVP